MDFKTKVNLVVSKIPRGKVMTYKQVGDKINSKAYRAIGNALNSNTDFKNIPCHRVVKTNGFIGGYVKGEKEKEKLLRKEGISIKNGKITSFKEHIWKNYLKH